MSHSSGGVTGVLWVKARNAVKDATMDRTSLTKSSQTQVTIEVRLISSHEYEEMSL